MGCYTYIMILTTEGLGTRLERYTTILIGLNTSRRSKTTAVYAVSTLRLRVRDSTFDRLERSHGVHTRERHMGSHAGRTRDGYTRRPASLASRANRNG